MMEEKITTNGDETRQLGEQSAEYVRTGGVLCLYGDLGGGKTTFTQGVAKALGIKKLVPSPTFLIVRTYDLQDNKFYHVDLYRLQSEQEIEDIGLPEILSDPTNIVVIEWSEKLGNLLPNDRIDVHFEYVGEDKRKITIKNISEHS